MQVNSNLMGKAVGNGFVVIATLSADDCRVAVPFPNIVFQEMGSSS